MPDLNYYNGLILQWARDRGILDNSTTYAQACKTAEEITELVQALTAKQFHGPGSGFHQAGLDAIADAIGDIYVTLIVGAEIAGVNLHVDESPIEDGKALARLMKFFVTLCRAVSAEKGPTALPMTYHAASESMIRSLQSIAFDYGLSLQGCVAGAYNEIKDRKGYLNAEGIFVKEQ